MENNEDFSGSALNMPVGAFGKQKGNTLTCENPECAQESELLYTAPIKNSQGVYTDMKVCESCWKKTMPEPPPTPMRSREDTLNDMVARGEMTLEQKEQYLKGEK